MSLPPPHAPQTRYAGRLVAVLFLLAGWLQPLAAHVVKQLYGEFHNTGETWELEILFDAGYADPVLRRDAGAPQPTRDWLVALPAAEQTRLTAEAKRYLEESLTLRSGGAKIEWQASFPDFDSTPPDFPSLLNDGAYFHVRLRPLASTPGKVTIAMAGGDHPDLVVKFPGAGDATYLTVAPGGEVVLKEGTGEKVAEGHSPVVVAFEQGVVHVVPRGFDHILFVLGIFLLRRRWKPLLAQSLAFTAAHTITLGLAAAGHVTVSTKIVEPLIALSIAALAVENLFIREARPWRLWIVFAFGLVHGLGFAGTLSTWIRPGEGFFLTLVSANLGVEAGQAIVLAAAWLLTTGWHESRAWPHFRRWACVALALTGLIWFVERVV
ncbi:HupE/UreJ family protein [Luteolibacter soli]|uniref:HupE/UreJ family protein n=1 Tax=Luteolibacter soli TaxID=3135280 RepID=A0ABU9ATH6_9BACT